VETWKGTLFYGILIQGWRKRRMRVQAFLKSLRIRYEKRKEGKKGSGMEKERLAVGEKEEMKARTLI
jgi:hypothetical protein